MNDLSDLENLLIPSNVSLEREREESVVVSEYNIKHSKNKDINMAEILNIDLDESFLEREELELEKVSNEKLFKLLNTKKIMISPEINFPKVKEINSLYNFLDVLGEQKINSRPVVFTKKSNEFDDIIEALVFFKFLEKNYIDGKDVYVITKYFKSFISQDAKQRYMYFIKILGANETIRKAISLQLNDPIYDRISKKMIINFLKEDLNVIEEKLNNDKIEEIVNNFRYWYLDIRNNILK